MEHPILRIIPPPHDTVDRAEQIAPATGDAAVSHAVRREHPEPISGNAPIPRWLTVLCVALTLSAGASLFFSLSNPDPLAANGEPTPGNVDPQILGKRLFAQNCSACHQPNGQGLPRLFPPLAGSEWVLGGSGIGDNHLVAILLHGLQGPIIVNGTSYNNAMPPWKHLTDEQIASVINHIRTEWGNASPAITADFVKAIREQTSVRSNPWAQKDLMAIKPTSVPHVPPQ